MAFIMTWACVTGCGTMNVKTARPRLRFGGRTIIGMWVPAGAIRDREIYGTTTPTRRRRTRWDRSGMSGMAAGFIRPVSNWSTRLRSPGRRISRDATAVIRGTDRVTELLNLLVKIVKILKSSTFGTIKPS